MRIHLTELWIGLGATLLVLSTLIGFWMNTSSTGAAVGAQSPFRALLPPPQNDILSVIQAAQGLDYWIRIQTGRDVTYLKGLLPCTSCSPLQEEQFFTPPQLHVDGQNFWIRLDEPNWRLNLRPSPDVPMGYELIVSPNVPKSELSSEDVSEILSTFSPLGVLPTQTGSLKFEPLIPSSKAAPPEGVRLDSVLYGLMLAPDWKDYASTNQIELSGLRAVVIVELNSPDAELPEGLNLVIESRSGGLVRAQALIHRLADLARDPAVTFVRLPSRPQPPSL